MSSPLATGSNQLHVQHEISEQFKIRQAIARDIKDSNLKLGDAEMQIMEQYLAGMAGGCKTMDGYRLWSKIHSAGDRLLEAKVEEICLNEKKATDAALGYADQMKRKADAADLETDKAKEKMQRAQYALQED